MNINVFDDAYFEHLQEIIEKRLEGKDIFIGNSCLFQNAISNKESFNLWRICLKKLAKQELDVIYFQYLLETNNLKKQYPILISDLEMPYEIVTGIAIPSVKVSSVSHILYENIQNNFELQCNSGFCDIEATNFICRGSERKATDEEIQNYLQTFSQKENYMLLLENLLISLHSCQFLDKYLIPPYLPSDIVSYYQQMDLDEIDQSLNDELYASSNHDYTKEKFESKQLLRKLKK